jgi:hypothetical protein
MDKLHIADCDRVCDMFGDGVCVGGGVGVRVLVGATLSLSDFDVEPENESEALSDSDSVTPVGVTRTVSLRSELGLRLRVSDAVDESDLVATASESLVLLLSDKGVLWCVKLYTCVAVQLVEREGSEDIDTVPE